MVTAVTAGSLMAGVGCQAPLEGTPVTNTTNTSTTTPSNPPVGVVDDGAGFYVKVIPNEQYTYTIHKGTGALSGDPTPDDFTSECKVTSSSVTKDISCIIEAQELDLWYHGVSLHYNVPKDMCSYLGWSKPYYYNLTPSMGPVDIVINKATSTITVNGSVVGSNGNGGFGDTTGGVSGDDKPYCATNYSDTKNPVAPRDGKGPNCCQGSYLLTVIPTAGDPTQTFGDWGGNAAKCLLGPAVDDGDGQGYPLSRITYVEGIGLNTKYDVVAPMSKLISNANIANFFDETEHGNDVPLAFRITNGFPATQPYYEFVCYDRSREVQARIRVMLREWNLASEFAKGVNGDPDLGTGLTEPGYPDHDQNDRYDWLDFGNNLPQEFIY